jgi:hypothetical protein
MSRGRFLRRSLLTSLATLAALLAVPSGASGATTVGQTFFPTVANTCLGGPDWEVLQTARVSGPSYATPSAGVLTSWSFEAGAAQTVMTLRVFRPTGTANQYQVIANGSELKTIAASSGLHTFPTQIPVQAGDFVGIYSRSGTCATQTNNTGDTYDFKFGTATAIGALGNHTPNNGFIWDISAQLESDCDNDGRGDETQDTNLSSCAPGTTPTGPPPTLPSGAPAICRGVAATIVGTNGSDARTGSPGQDVIVALGGNDTLSGLGGNDVICAGAGKDSLRGGKGKDTLLGQKGKDALNGGGSRDFCKGGKGTDTASKCEVEKSI